MFTIIVSDSFAGATKVVAYSGFSRKTLSLQYRARPLALTSAKVIRRSMLAVFLIGHSLLYCSDRKRSGQSWIISGIIAIFAERLLDGRELLLMQLPRQQAYGSYRVG